MQLRNLFFPWYIFITGFILLYLLLSFHARLASDDFFYLWLSNSFGAWDGMLYQYEKWSGRWSAHFIACLLIPLWEHTLFLPIFYLLTLAGLFSAIHSLLLKFFQRQGIHVNRSVTLLLGSTLCASFFFSTYGIGETWFWYIIVVTYLWSIIAFLVVLNIILSMKQRKAESALLIILSAFIGGASESFAIVFIFFLSCLFILRIKVNAYCGLVINKRNVVLSIAVISLSFLFSVLAPGTEVRYSLLPHPPLIEKVFIIGKTFVKHFVRYLPEKSVYLFLFTLPWLLFGSLYFRNNFRKKRVIQLLLKGGTIYLLIIGIMIVPASFALSETGPDRALSLLSLATSVFLAFAFAIIGSLINFNSTTGRTIFLALSTVALIDISRETYIQYKLTHRFASAYDERIIYVKSIEEDISHLELEPLPDQGMLYWEELSADTAYFVNAHFRNGMQLPFSVVVK